MSEFRIINHPGVLMRPRMVAPYSWAGHIPFAYLAVELIRPRRFVELGTHTGNSYLAVCQAVAAGGFGAQCFAVDTWQGDEHASVYGEDVYEALSSYHDPRYSGFSTLLRKTFDAALNDIEDGTVDLLHIDGLHTYEAVKHDFETWLPKLSSRAVVLMHDVAVLDRNFGVWKYFEELAERYRTFSFSHSNGLGVVCVGDQLPEAFEAFVYEIDRSGDSIKQFFEAVAATLIDPTNGLPAGVAVRATSTLNAQLFYRSEDQVFAEERSVALTRKNVEGQVLLRFELPQGACSSYVRIDPSDSPGVYGVSALALVSRAGEYRDLKDFPSRVRSLGGDRLDVRPPAFYRFVTLDADPFIEFNFSDIVADISFSDVATVEISLVCESVIQDPVTSDLAAQLGSATAQVRSRARDAEHLANLIQAAQAALVGGQVDLGHRLSNTTGEVIAETRAMLSNELSSVSADFFSVISDASARQEMAGVEDRLAIEVLNEKLDAARIDKASEASVGEVQQVLGVILETLKSQGARLESVNEAQRRTGDLVHALHKRIDKRSPLYLLRRMFGRKP